MKDTNKELERMKRVEEKEKEKQKAENEVMGIILLALKEAGYNIIDGDFFEKTKGGIIVDHPLSNVLVNTDTPKNGVGWYGVVSEV